MLFGVIKNTIVLSILILVLAISLVFYGNFKEERDRAKMLSWSDTNKIVLTKENAILNPFQIEFDQAEWDLLLLKLNSTRYFTRLDEKYAERHEYGFDPEYAETLINYWKTSFNWKKKVDYLNKYPQFKLVINKEVTIHYLRYITNKNLNQVPKKLIMFDGWPGHFFGFFKMIDLIEKLYDKQSFDIIVPSIPGYGYSTPLTKPVDQVETAQLFDALMRFVHGDSNCQYYLHGEDWGAIIANLMAKLYPARVKGFHITMPTVPMSNPITLFYGVLAQWYPSLVLNEEELKLGLDYGILNQISFLIRASGYFHIQATKPDTLAHGLTDSPIGLLGWILEKYSLGTFGQDAIGPIDGKLDSLDRDDLLTILTYYWMTNSISTSIRLYRTYWLGKARELENYKVTVPLGVHRFKKEISFIPSVVLKNFYLNVTRITHEKIGGHFASFENPKLSAIDFVEFIQQLN